MVRHALKHGPNERIEAVQMDDVFYSVEEVATKIDVHPRSIRRYISSGELSAIRSGNKWIVRQGDLTEFINDRNPAQRHNGKGIKEDDLCVFMDRGNHHPNCRIKISTVVDVMTDDPLNLQPLLDDLAAVMARKEHRHCFESKMDHVYSKKGKKMRFVIWGSPDIIAQAMAVFGEHVNACE